MVVYQRSRPRYVKIWLFTVILLIPNIAASSHDITQFSLEDEDKKLRNTWLHMNLASDAWCRIIKSRVAFSYRRHECVPRLAPWKIYSDTMTFFFRERIFNFPCPVRRRIVIPRIRGNVSSFVPRRRREEAARRKQRSANNREQRAKPSRWRVVLVEPTAISTSSHWNFHFDVLMLANTTRSTSQTENLRVILLLWNMAIRRARHTEIGWDLTCACTAGNMLKKTRRMPGIVARRHIGKITNWNESFFDRDTSVYLQYWM